MPSMVKWGFALAIFSLSIAFLLPGMIDMPTQRAEQSVLVENDSSERITDFLNVSVEDLTDGSPDSATFVLRNSDTLNDSRNTINEGQNVSVQLSGDTINATVDNITMTKAGTNTTRLTVEYPPLFGWDSGPRLFLENIDILFALIAGLMALGLVVVRI